MEKPEAGWLKCNFEGAWKEQGKKGGIGVVFRDDMGLFVAAMAMKMKGISSPMLAELEVARELSTEQLKLKGGATLVLAAITLQTEDDLSLWVNRVNEACYFLRSIPQTKINHTRRDTNKVAHRLAQVGLTLNQ
ncbi:uncharacterized protein [Pyrus communis]|uniref:uncharacterized protein n=1 Tax=Pyrus communis TaxID=23211 RepID=UPI0035C19DD0